MTLESTLNWLESIDTANKKSKEKALESTLFKNSQAQSNRRANEVLNQTMKDLSLLPQDILSLTVDYINYNISARNAEYNEQTQLLDTKKYAPKNYNKDKFDTYKQELSLPDNVKLDFQILLYAITSEPLLREYFYKTSIGRDGNKKIAEQMSNTKGPWSHQDLAISFASELSQFNTRLNGNAFQMNRLHLSDYIINLKGEVKKGASSKKIINELLENLPQYYVFDHGHSF